MTTKGIKFEVAENVLLVIHSANDPDPREWDEFLDFYARVIGQIQGVLVYSPGPGPGSTQRRRIAEINQVRAAPIAVVTPSRLARGIVAALSWFGVPIKAFDVDAFARALDFLKVTGPSRVAITKRYDLLCESVSLSPDARERA
jgi:hypothetical protein